MFQGHSLEYNNAINKTLGKVWKQATKKEKMIYEEKATADKLRYLQVRSLYSFVRRVFGYFSTGGRTVVLLPTVGSICCENTRHSGNHDNGGVAIGWMT